MDLQAFEPDNPAHIGAIVSLWLQRPGNSAGAHYVLPDSSGIAKNPYDFSAIFQFINVGDTKIGNIWDTEFHGEPAFYLAGYMAAKFSKTAKVGFAKPDVWNVEIPIENAPNPHATLMQNFVDSILDGTPLIAPGAQR